MVKKSIDDYLPPIPDIEKQLTGIFKAFLFEKPSYDDNAYSHIHASMKEWSMISKEEAEPYLPIKQDPISVELGFKNETKEYLISTLSTMNLESAIPLKRGGLINTGGVILGLDYVPKTVKNKIHQHLSIGGLKEPKIDFAYRGDRKGYSNAIQIWRCDLHAQENQEVSINLDLCILHDFGDVREIKWCPYGAYDDIDDNNNNRDVDDQSLSKLGILAACFGDGSLQIMVVPHPELLRKKQNIKPDESIFLKVNNSRYSMSFNNSIITEIAWGGYKKLALGTSSGQISVWNMEAALHYNNTDNADNRLQKKFMIFNNTVHDSGVRRIAWHGWDDPVNFASAGNDGQIFIVDINDPFVPILIQRARSIQYAVCWPGHRNRMYITEGETTIKEISVNDCTEFKQGQYYAACKGSCYCISACESHCFIVHCSSDGFVTFHNAWSQRIRGVLKSQPTVYQLNYNEQNHKYKYLDGFKPLGFDEAKALPLESCLYHPLASINKVCFNPNHDTSSWIASGGNNGLCRIDFLGLGKDW
ncbi:unnamed protein product [Cunninghamella blakesleeana]